MIVLHGTTCASPAATVDLEHDRVSRTAGRKVQCPLVALWGANGKIAEWYDAISIWRAYCSVDVTGAAIPCGHYLAEEAPEAVLAVPRVLRLIPAGEPLLA